MEVMIEEHFTNTDGSTELYVTQESLLADFSAFVLIRDAPFKEKIDNCMMVFHTAGLIGKWKDNAMDDVRRDGRKKRRKLRIEAEETIVTAEGIIKPLTMVHMQGPFLLYILCVIVSFIAFLVEVVRGPFLQSNQ
ncbi:uncharacterized protein LOC123517998 [Portunus trituberculatus]|uniref:uncharacterized protein LOC123517998 n=1 Tax=Portunus trituberculatus TaxID=210409 RepID=UPI001E1CBA8A|nr:uncharacterized protein LOC123517998 [Portunus trituberculatus]